MGLNKNQLANLMELISSKQSTATPTSTTKTTPLPILGVQGDIKNAITRLNASGVDTSNQVDNRNFVEKALNLTPDQNFLFDFFEVLNRPQQALFGAISAGQNNEDIGAGAMAGFTGDKDFYGGDIVRKAIGQEENTNGKDLLKQMADPTNWAGLVLDVVADPLDLGLALVTGGASVGVQAGAKVAGTTGDLAKINKTAELLKDGVKIASDGAETLADVVKVGQKAKNPLNLVNSLQDLTLGKGKRLYVPKNEAGQLDVAKYFDLLTSKASREQAKITKTSLQNMAMKPLFSGLKAGTLMGDSILEAGLKPLNEGKTLEGYRALKTSIAKTARESGAKVKKIIGKSKENKVIVEAQFKELQDNFILEIKNIAIKAGVSPEDVGIMAQAIREYSFSGARMKTANDFVEFITNTPIKYLPYSEETLIDLRRTFGNEFIAKNVIEAQVGPFRTLKFDDNAFDRSKFGDLWKSANSETVHSAMNTADIAKYERALMAKSPEEYAVYKQAKDTYEEALPDRIDEEMSRLYPNAETRFSPEELAKKRKTVEKSVRLQDMNNPENYQHVLKRQVKTDELGNYIFDADSRRLAVKKLNITDQVEYNKIRAEENDLVDAEIERLKPKSQTPADEAGKKAYRAQQNAIGAKLRAEGANAKSDAFLSKVKNVGSEDTLGVVKTVDDIDGFIKNIQGELHNVNANVRARIENIMDMEKELANATDDVKIKGLQRKITTKKDELFTVLSGKEVPKRVYDKVVKPVIANAKIVADTTKLSTPISRDLINKITNIIEGSNIGNKNNFIAKLNSVLSGESKVDDVIIRGLNELIYDFEGDTSELVVFLQRFDKNFGTSVLSGRPAKMLSEGMNNAVYKATQRAEDQAKDIVGDIIPVKTTTKKVGQYTKSLSNEDRVFLTNELERAYFQYAPGLSKIQTYLGLTKMGVRVDQRLIDEVTLRLNTMSGNIGKYDLPRVKAVLEQIDAEFGTTMSKHSIFDAIDVKPEIVEDIYDGAKVAKEIPAKLIGDPKTVRLERAKFIGPNGELIVGDGFHESFGEELGYNYGRVGMDKKTTINSGKPFLKPMLDDGYLLVVNEEIVLDKAPTPKQLETIFAFGDNPNTATSVLGHEGEKIENVTHIRFSGDFGDDFVSGFNNSELGKKSMVEKINRLYGSNLEVPTSKYANEAKQATEDIFGDTTDNRTMEQKGQDLLDEMFVKPDPKPAVEETPYKFVDEYTPEERAVADANFEKRHLAKDSKELVSNMDSQLPQHRAFYDVQELDDVSKKTVRDKTVENIANGRDSDVAEMVPIKQIEQFMEHDRLLAPWAGPNKIKSKIKDLADDIAQNGMKEPLMLEFNPETGFGYIGEGNHRIAIAKMLGLEEVPVRVNRSLSIKLDGTRTKGGYISDTSKITAFTGGTMENGVEVPKHWKAEMKPSEIGLESSPLVRSGVGEIIESPQQVIDNVANTIPGNAVDPNVPLQTGTNGQIRIGNYYTADQIKDFEKNKNLPWVQEATKLLDDTITKAQRIVGQYEFNNAEALINKSTPGYITHTMTEDALKAVKEINEDYVARGKARGMSTVFFAPGRTKALGMSDYIGSAKEANNFHKEFYKKVLLESDWVQKNMEGISDEARAVMEDYFSKNLFAEDARASVDAFMTKTYGALNWNHRTTDILTGLAFGNADGSNSALKVVKESENAPSGFVKLSERETRQLKNTIAMNMKYAGTGEYSEKLVTQIREGLGQSKVLTMEKHLYDRMLNTSQRTGEAYLNFVDQFNKMFKMGKTLSPGFNFKNMVGNATNMWLVGVPAHSIFKYWNIATDMNKQMTTILKKITEVGMDGLDEGEHALYKTYREFADAGFMSKATVYRMQDLISPDDIEAKSWSKGFQEVKPKDVENVLHNPLQPIISANMQLNLAVDNNSRLTLYLYAKQNPEILTKAGLDPADPNSAMNLVRLALFDPNDLSFFEDDVMKRLVPFYTFTRQNLAFQAKNVVNNSDKYYKMYKAYNAWNKEMYGVDKEDLTGYQRNQFYLPIFGKKDGDYVGLKMSLPMSALTELSFDAQAMAQQFTSKLTPLIKAPLELASGTNTLTGQKISNYQGEMSKNIPILDKGQEWALGQIGGDVPAKDISGLLDMLGQGSKAIQGQPSDVLRGVNTMSGVTTNISPATNELSKAYETLDRLNAKIKAVKGAGGTVQTIAEINAQLQGNQTSTKLNDMQTIMDMINNIKR